MAVILNDCVRSARIEKIDNGSSAQDRCRPLIWIGHSLGGLLLKQALVNAHDNKHYAEIESSVKGFAFFGTLHEGGNIEKAKVKPGFTAAKIAESLGFNINDSIIQALTPGSLFGDFLRKSSVISSKTTSSSRFGKRRIVTKESATFELPGLRENIIGLESDRICRFNFDDQDDRDMYESFVKHNFQWLYEEALKDAFLEDRLERLRTASQDTLQPNELQSRPIESIMQLDLAVLECQVKW
ncbi:hypothetical protein F5Y01DRAFT_312194 [Xylaria sp. FL0043]|nr:hypothetical protein F5Y01DRAFT_312194 [Xylaria sp. FL0043]